MSESKKVWTYIRKASLPENTSIAEQKALFRTWCEDQGYEVVGETAVIGSRKTVKTDIENILNQTPSANGAELLLTPSFSQLFNNAECMAEILKELDEHGIGIIAADNKDNPSLQSFLQMIKDIADTIPQTKDEHKDEGINGEDNIPQLKM